MIEDKIKNYVTVQLRRIFKWSSAYAECKTRSRLPQFKEVYRCEGCECIIQRRLDEDLSALSERVFGEEMHVDHINPVVPLSGFKSSQEWAQSVILNMFPSAEGLMHLCQSCHYLKSTIEAGLRADFRKEILK